jgi:Domain of unknown function (DUF4395)
MPGEKAIYTKTNLEEYVVGPYAGSVEGLTGWIGDNLTTQGYRLSDSERRRLWLGLRFPTALCLALVIVALVLQSVPMLAALSGIGLVAGFTRRHPFDLLWNHGLRHLMNAPELPPNPTRRRHAFKLATVWLLAVAALFAAGADAVALSLGLVLVGVCGLVTATNFCVPSTLIAWWDRRRRREALPT